jgi:hypothetical protein
MTRALYAQQWAPGTFCVAGWVVPSGGCRRRSREVALLFLPGNKSRYLGGSVRSAVTKPAGLSRLLDWVKLCLRKFGIAGGTNYSYRQSHLPTDAHNRRKKINISFKNFYMFRHRGAILRGSQIHRSTSTNTSTLEAQRQIFFFTLQLATKAQRG